MAKKQLKHIMVKVEQQGAKEANSQLAAMEEHIFNINAGLRGIDKGGSLENLSRIGKSLQSVNKALSGDTKSLTKKLSGYIENLDIVALSLKEVERQANLTNKALNKTNSIMQGSTSASANYDSKLEVIVGSLQGLEETFEEVADSMKDLNRVMGISAEVLDDINESTNGARKTNNQYENEKQKQHNNEKKRQNDQRRWHGEGSSRIRSFSSLAFGMNPLVSTYAAIAVNVYALSEAFRVLNEAAGLARLEETTASFAAAISGINVKALAVELQEAAAGALNMKEALRFATKGVSFNFTSEQLTKLTDGARRASIALGIDFTDAMDRVTRGISKQEIELFDELGIVTRLTPAFQKLAITLNKSVDELSDYERQLALTNEVQRQLEEKYSGVQKYATGWERLGVAVSNFTTLLLKNSAVGMDSFIGKVAEYLEKLTPIITAQDKAAESLAIYNQAMNDNKIPQALQAYSEYVRFQQEAIDNAEQEAERLSAHKEAVGQLTTALKILAGAWALSMGANVLAATAQGVVAVTTAIKAFRTATLGAAAATLALSAPFMLFVTAALGAVAYFSGGLDFALKKIDSFVSSIFTATKTIESPLDSAKTGIDKIDGSARKAAKSAKDMQEELKKLGVAVDTTTIANEAAIKANAKVDSIINAQADAWARMSKEYASAERSKLFRFYYQEEFEKSMKKATVQLETQAQSSMKWRKGMADTKNSIVEVAQAAQEAKTPLDKILDKLKSYESPKLVTSKDELNMQAWKDFLAELRNEGIINKNITPEDMPAFLEKMRQVNEQSKNFKENFSTQLKVQNLGDFSGDQDLNAKKRELEGITAELENQQSLEFTANSKDAKALANKKLILEAEIARAEKLKEINQAQQLETLSFNIATQRAALEAKVNKTLEFQVQQRQIAIDYEKEMLQYQKAKGEISDYEYENAMALLAVKQQILDKTDAEVISLREQSTIFNSIGNISGLSGSQQAVAQLGSTITSVFADLEEQDIGLAELFEQDVERLTEVANSAISVIGSIYGAISDAKIAGYDREIEAEKRRDGKSAESLAKIKKLEAKKIKEQGKAKKAQIIMSTSVAAARALELGPILGPIMAGIMVTMGMFQLSQVDKAMAGQLASLNTPSNQSMSITGGNSNNSVDVSRGASSSEYAQAANIPGRVGGNSAPAGASIEVGERGAEIITPTVPVEVSPAGKSSGGVTVELGGLYVDAIDASNFEERIESIGGKLREVLEEQLNRTNQSLENL